MESARGGSSGCVGGIGGEALPGAGFAKETERFIAWHNAPTSPMLIMIKPLDGQPATVGNGTMVALAVGSTAMVDAIHAKALELGGKDEGAPGNRGENFYAAYFRDLEGNKLAAFHMG
jgi:hypothetical protein